MYYHRELISPDHKSTFDNKIVQFTSGGGGKQSSQQPKAAQPPPSSGSKQQQPAARKPQTVIVEAEPGKDVANEAAKPPKNTEAIRLKVLTQASKVLKIKDELKGVEKRLKQVRNKSLLI